MDLQIFAHPFGVIGNMRFHFIIDTDKVYPTKPTLETKFKWDWSEMSVSIGRFHFDWWGNNWREKSKSLFSVHVYYPVVPATRSGNREMQDKAIWFPSVLGNLLLKLKKKDRIQKWNQGKKGGYPT